ncbi:hypothetical protein EVAR_73430_1, partial [Eumeta japonica]
MECLTEIERLPLLSLNLIKAAVIQYGGRACFVYPTLLPLYTCMARPKDIVLAVEDDELRVLSVQTFLYERYVVLKLFLTQGSDLESFHVSPINVKVCSRLSVFHYTINNVRDQQLNVLPQTR